MLPLRRLFLPGLLLLCSASGFDHLPAAVPASSAGLAKAPVKHLAQLTPQAALGAPTTGPTVVAPLPAKQTVVLFYVTREVAEGTTTTSAYPFACYDRTRAKYLLDAACRDILPAQVELRLADDRIAQLGKSISTTTSEQGEDGCTAKGYQVDGLAKPARAERSGNTWAVWPPKASRLMAMDPLGATRSSTPREIAVLSAARDRAYRQSGRTCHDQPDPIPPVRIKGVWQLDVDGDSKLDAIYTGDFKGDSTSSDINDPSNLGTLLLLRRGREPSRAAVLVHHLCTDSYYLAFAGSVDLDQDGQREIIYSQSYEGSLYFLARLHGDELQSQSIGCMP